MRTHFTGSHTQVFVQFTVALLMLILLRVGLPGKSQSKSKPGK